MGRIYASMFLTLDGVIEAPHVWHPPYISEESMQVLADQMAGASAMLLGRRTYEDFAGYWPHQSDDVPLAKATNGIRKYVVTRTLASVEWSNTEVVDLAAVRSVGERHDVVMVPGGAELVRALLGEGLLDELRITLDPVVVGHGRRLFGDGFKKGLELVEHRCLPHGVMHLVYRP